MSSRRILLITCLVTFVLFIWLRVHMYEIYNSQWIDSDQTISWLMAQDVSNGDFYTPYFYGQFYNINVDAFVAGLILKLGGSPQHVLPIVSNILGALPFLMLGIGSIKSRQYILAALVFALGIVLPIQFHMLTSVARGFIGGIAVFTVGAALIYGSNRNVFKVIGYWLITASLFVNPNVLFLFIPATALWYNHFKHVVKGEVGAIFIGFALTFITFLTLRWFQSTSVLQEVHRLWRLEWKLEYLSKNLTTIDLRWRYLFPLVPKSGSLWIGVAALISLVYGLKKNRLMMWATIATLIALIFSLGLNKTLDGTNSVFFPYSRMYLAIPFAMLLLVIPLVKSIQASNIIAFTVFTVFSVSGFVYQTSKAEKVVINSIRANDGTVQVKQINRLETECDSIEKLMARYNVEFVSFYYKSDEFTYGCPCLNKRVKTLYPDYDRRLWTFNDLANTSADRLLILDWSLSIDKKLTAGIDTMFKVADSNLPAYVVEGKDLSILSLFERNHLTLRPH